MVTFQMLLSHVIQLFAHDFNMTPEQQNKVLALLLAITYADRVPDYIVKAITKVLVKLPAEEVSKAADTKINFGETE